jgi:hypothetical protein
MKRRTYYYDSQRFHDSCYRNASTRTARADNANQLRLIEEAPPAPKYTDFPRLNPQAPQEQKPAA